MELLSVKSLMYGVALNLYQSLKKLVICTVVKYLANYIPAGFKEADHIPQNKTK